MSMEVISVEIDDEISTPGPRRDRYNLQDSPEGLKTFARTASLSSDESLSDIESDDEDTTDEERENEGSEDENMSDFEEFNLDEINIPMAAAQSVALMQIFATDVSTLVYNGLFAPTVESSRKSPVEHIGTVPSDDSFDDDDRYSEESQDSLVDDRTLSSNSSSSDCNCDESTEEIKVEDRMVVPTMSSATFEDDFHQYTELTKSNNQDSNEYSEQINEISVEDNVYTVLSAITSVTFEDVVDDSADFLISKDDEEELPKKEEELPKKVVAFTASQDFELEQNESEMLTRSVESKNDEISEVQSFSPCDRVATLGSKHVASTNDSASPSRFSFYVSSLDDSHMLLKGTRPTWLGSNASHNIVEKVDVTAEKANVPENAHPKKSCADENNDPPTPDEIDMEKSQFFQDLKSLKGSMSSSKVLDTFQPSRMLLKSKPKFAA